MSEPTPVQIPSPALLVAVKKSAFQCLQMPEYGAKDHKAAGIDGITIEELPAWV